MNKTTYESLQVWQKSHQLAILVYKATIPFPKEELFGVTSQLRRSSLSVPTNIAEGYARQNPNVFKNFLDIAYGSLIETKYLLNFSNEIGYLSPENYQKLVPLTEEAGALIWKFTQAVTERRSVSKLVV